MSKRFIDTGLFDDSWFMDLSKDAKILWMYMITKCNHAGLIQFNPKLCALQTGIKDYQITLQEIGARVVKVKEHFYFIPKYIIFQYPGFPNSNVKQQQSAVNELERHGLYKDGELLFKDLGKSSITVTKDLGNSIDTVSDCYVNVNDNVIRERRKHLFKNDEFSDFEKFKTQFENSDFADADFKYYYDAFMDWSNSKGAEKIDWIATVRNGMRSDKQNGKYHKASYVQAGQSLNGFEMNPNWKKK